MSLRGLLKVRVLRGVNLAIRDVKTSDPYVVVRHGSAKLKTRVIKKNVNPEWNEDLAFSSANPYDTIRIEVFDKDRFSRDDRMGDAEIDIRPLLAAASVSPEDVPESNVVQKLAPSRMNSLASDSSVYWLGGSVIQDVILRLNNVECGEVELQLQWAPKRSSFTPTNRKT